MIHSFSYRLFLGICLAAVLPACTPIAQLPLKTDSDAVLLRNPGSSVNSEYDELAPSWSSVDSVLVFSSNRPVGSERSESQKLYALRLFGAEWSRPARIVTDMPDEVNEGALAFTTDLPDISSSNDTRASRDAAAARNTGTATDVVFVQCYREDGTGDCDISSASIVFDPFPEVGGKIESAWPLGPVVNDRDWDSHPTLSSDGRTLIFASERFGGEGESDLWMSRRDDEGVWSLPVNLGDSINTSGSEITPFVSGDARTLYFASDRHPGYGGFDLFVSKNGGEGWSAPVNLGSPWNSPSNDIFYSESFRDSLVFLSSDREGGSGGFDLYIFRRDPPPPVVLPEPLVLRCQSKNAFTMQPIPAEINMTEDADGEIRVAKGEGSITTPIEAGKAYTVTAYRSGFLNAVETFSYPEGSTGTQNRVLLLTPVVEDERKIYAFTVEFDFNLSHIRPEEEAHLDSVASLLISYPNSTVVLSGHTDSVGTATYNIKLGYNRAKEVSRYVETYLKRKSVNLRNDMEFRTYGETMPVAPNRTDEGRQRNRRVEIAIIRNQ